MSLKNTLEEIDRDLNGDINSGRVRLIAVTKYASDEQIIEAYKLGLRDFGENYVIPALKKRERLKDFLGDDINWHLLGPLQSNKVNKAVGHFKTIQSIHDLEIASEINKRAETINHLQEVFIQVNSCGTKSGFEIDELKNIFPKLLQLKNLQICGLMTMGFEIVSKNSETIYKNLRQCKEMLVNLYPEVDLELSMGMSNDYKVAVENSAKIIRLGRKLFKESKKNPGE